MKYFTILICIIMIFFCSKSDKQKGAIVSFVAGDVLIEHLDSSVEKAQLKTIVNINDTIITNKKSQVIIQIPNVGIVRVLENSRVFINSFSERKIGTVTTLFKGSMFSKIIKNNKYKIFSKTFTAAVRGTEFLVTNNEYTEEALVYKGSIDIIAVMINKKEKVNAGQVGFLFEDNKLIKRNLDSINLLSLKILSVPYYIKNIADITIEELTTINNKNRDDEKKIESEKEILNKQIEEETDSVSSKTLNNKTPNKKQFKLLTQYRGHKYYLSTFRTNWENAQAICTKNGGHLVTITSIEEHNMLYKAIWKNNPYRSIWIGLKRNKKSDKWTWVSGERFVYSRWNPGEPNNHDNNQYYALIWDLRGYKTWDDERGDKSINFILETR